MSSTGKGKIKSLQDMSASNTLQELEQDDEAIDFLTSLELKSLRVLLPYLWEDYIRLREVERKMPTADRHIHFGQLKDSVGAQSADGNKESYVKMVGSGIEIQHNRRNAASQNVGKSGLAEPAVDFKKRLVVRNHFFSRWRHVTECDSIGLTLRYTGTRLPW